MSRLPLVPTLLAVGLLLAFGSSLPAAAAEKFPSRPVTFISPFAPGGPTEAQLRVLGAQAEKIWGVPVVIDVKPGAGSTLGPATMAATAKPDGYTLCVLSVGVFTVPWMQKVTFDPATDFTYVIQLSGWRGHMVVRQDAPWKTWKDFVAEAKARKASKVKQAKVDAERDVQNFKNEEDYKFEQFRAAQLGGADSENAKLVQETDKQIADMKKLAAERIEKVSNMMVSLICAASV